jgi:hypothetical protein
MLLFGEFQTRICLVKFSLKLQISAKNIENLLVTIVLEKTNSKIICDV